MRLFVAVSLDAPTREAIDRSLRPGRERGPRELRWIASEGWHLTLQFLGATREDRVAPLEDALRRAVARERAFEVVFGGAGAFPSERHARVVWIGAARGASELAAIATGVVRETSALGFEAEARPFHAHLTVARLKRPAPVERLLTALRVPEIVQPVREIVLYRSHLGSAGSRYEALSRLPLGG